jgi:UDP-glucose 4-epimerase
LKQIEACNDNYEEASKIIIDGAINSRIAAETNEFKSACFISSDKSRAATTIYGAMKYVAGESFIAGKSECNLTTAIYGNVMNSTGSIIPLIWNYIESGKTLQLYGADMTRFLMDVQDAIDLILKSLDHRGGCNIIPVLTSFKILDLFDIYKKMYGLKYEVTSPRTGEKIHEIMASSEEIRRMNFDHINGIYTLNPKDECIEPDMFKDFTNNEYSSRDRCHTISQLTDFLESKNYYKP